MAPGELEIPRAGGQLGVGVLSTLAQSADHVRMLDDALGGGAALPVARGHIEMVQRFLTDYTYTPAVGRQLWFYLSDAAREAAWAAYDGGNHDLAVGYYHVALRAAHQADDRPLGAYTLTHLAHLHASHGDLRTAELMLDAARDKAWPQMGPAERAVWFGFSARLAGMRRDANSVTRWVGEGETAMAAVTPGTTPAYAYWMVPVDYSGMAGAAYADAGDSGRAVRHLRMAVEGSTAGHGRPGTVTNWDRDHALWQLKLAHAHMAAGDADAAVQVAEPALSSVQRLSSGRLTTLTRRLAGTIPQTRDSRILEFRNRATAAIA
jgi:hypothetical protein